MTDKARLFMALHERDRPFVMPNAWDIGSARLLASIGFEALATTSGGFAATLGRLDGSVTRDEALRHSTELVEATPLPVSADLEHGWADDPSGVAETVERALATGLAGCSIEDWSGETLYDIQLAKERVGAAAEAAHGSGPRLVLTARAENFIHGRPDLADTIARLQAFEEAGADVLFAPGVREPEDIRQVVNSVDCPLNVLVTKGTPPLAELAELGVRRISVGGALAYAAYGAAADAARQILADGTFGYLEAAAAANVTLRAAFNPLSFNASR